MPITSSADLTAHRKAKREKGLCGWIGCKEQSGESFHCPEHAARHAKRMRDKRAKKPAVAA